jgi:hypothetical protein
LNILQAGTIYATEYSDTRKTSLPIEIVDKTTNMPTEAVVIGDGINTVIEAMPYVKIGNKEQPKQAWRCLLDSGSDDDLKCQEDLPP